MVKRTSIECVAVSVMDSSILFGKQLFPDFLLQSIALLHYPRAERIHRSKGITRYKIFYITRITSCKDSHNFLKVVFLIKFIFQLDYRPTINMAPRFGALHFTAALEITVLYPIAKIFLIFCEGGNK